MNFSTFFNFGNKQMGANTFDPMPEIYTLGFPCNDFVKTDIIHIYQKILTDVLERTHGLSDEEQTLMWDNCLKSEASKGLITILAEAMFFKSECYLVLDSGIIRKATSVEQAQIKNDYGTKASSETGIYISFQNYSRTDMLKLYSTFEYHAIDSLNNNMNLSKAIQFKISDLRGSTSLIDSEAVSNQAKNIAMGLRDGRSVSMDAKDEIVNAEPKMDATKAAIDFLNQKRAFYLGMPAAYTIGEQTTGMNSTGEADTKAIERGLKNYYFSILKPVVEALFDVTVSYKSQDFRQITQGLEALKTFSLVDDSLISYKDKQVVINQLFDFDTAEGSDREASLEKPKAVIQPPPTTGVNV